MDRKYELLENETITIGNMVILYRIKAVKDFGCVKAGDIGGYIESEDNLSHEGNCWVSGNAKVYGDAGVSGNGRVSDNAYIDSTDKYLSIGPIGSRNDFTTFYLDKSGIIWVNCGCFNDSIDEFEKAVNNTHKNTDFYGIQYLKAIEYAKKHFN